MREFSKSKFSTGKFSNSNKKKPFFKKSDPLFGREFSKKSCRFCADKIKQIDYKDINKLMRFTTEKGKILSCRISGNCAKHQRKLSEAIKRARFLALLPFVKR